MSVGTHGTLTGYQGPFYPLNKPSCKLWPVIEMCTNGQEQRSGEKGVSIAYFGHYM